MADRPIRSFVTTVETMIFSKDILFLHVPKTGGMSITSYLLEVLPPPVYYTRPEVDEAFARRPGIVQVLGARHESLPEVVGLLPRYGFSLSDFRLILAVLRNPYDLEVSRYHYLRAGHPWDYGPNQRLALTRDFTTFAANSSLSEQNSVRSLENYFHSNGEIPPNLRIIRFESLETDIKEALSSLGIEDRADFPWRNKSRHDDYLSYYTKEAEEAIYNKYRWVFDAGFYDRMTEWATSRGDGKVEPAYTVPLVGPVHQEGRAAGFAPDCWVDGSLRVTVMADEFVSEVTLEGLLPDGGAADEVTLSLNIGGQEAAATFPAGETVSWTIPCVLQPNERPELKLRSSATWCPKNAGISEDTRDLAIMLKRVAFVPTARVMKRNWDQRARENPGYRRNGDESNYFEAGRIETEERITNDLDTICAGTDPKAMTVLEIGCGPGRMTKHLADIFGDVRAVDVSPEMIALARENLADHDNVRLYETNGIDLSPFEDELFDFCLVSGVFHRVPVRGIIINYIRAVYRTLRSERLFKFEVQGVPTGVANTWGELGFAEPEMLELAESIGFEVQKTEGAGTEHYWQWWTRK
jgi:SAM-dependent methyltransferase